jgi:hypothetical protein
VQDLTLYDQATLQTVGQTQTAVAAAQKKRKKAALIERRAHPLLAAGDVK